MIPYLSIINTPGGIIVFSLMIVCVFCLVFAVDTALDGTTLHSITTGLISVILCIFLTWILVGDSTEWSKPIGLWLRDK